jgi:epoxyqueuosine reductase
MKMIKKKGFKGKIVSIEHIHDLEREMAGHRQDRSLDDDLYNAYLDRFAFDRSDDAFNAQSVIIVTAPQPQLQVTFQWRGHSYPCIIPPTYDCATDHQMAKSLESILRSGGYHLEKKRLPQKILAVRSGIAKYGKNNITYVRGLGSFHRLVVFVSDLPCTVDSWGERQLLDDCRECDFCRKACPTGAISSERFLLYGERCITFHNELSGNFPAWLNPSWHNSLVGCMICQKVCPVNKNFRQWVVDGPVFSEGETACLLEGISEEKIPGDLAKKIKQLDMMEYLDVLGRNLQALTGI